MDLFTKADKQKEFLDSNTVLIHLKSNGKFNVTIHDNFLTVEPRGFTNAVNKGLIGQKTYDLNNVSGVQYKKPGFTTGYLQIVLIGGRDARNGVLDEIRTLKELLDIGAITDEEFEAKKAQLLNL